MIENSTLICPFSSAHIRLLKELFLELSYLEPEDADSIVFRPQLEKKRDLTPLHSKRRSVTDRFTR